MFRTKILFNKFKDNFIKSLKNNSSNKNKNKNKKNKNIKMNNIDNNYYDNNYFYELSSLNNGLPDTLVDKKKYKMNKNK